MISTLAHGPRRSKKGAESTLCSPGLARLYGQLATARRALQAALRGGAATRNPKLARALAASLVYLERGREVLGQAR